MKKIILFILAILWNFHLVWAANLEVRSNLESWEYNFPIEINLITNDKNAKIFYYTDGEGRMDNIKEFKSPLLLKEDTTIDFYATNKNYEDTLIHTSKYTFSYSEKIILDEKNGKLLIKNTSWDIQNIWYWTMKSSNFYYEIPANTYIENKETYQIDYTLTDNEKIQLFSPDNKVIKTFTYKKTLEKKETPVQSEIIIPTQTEIKVPQIQTGKTLTSATIPIPQEQEITNTEVVNIEEVDLNSALKTSVIDTKNESKESKSNNLFIILAVLFLFILYNIGLFLKKSDTFQEFKTKINKIWKK